MYLFNCILCKVALAAVGVTVNKALLYVYYVCFMLFVSLGWDSGLSAFPPRGGISWGVGIGPYSKSPF
jgi:hypothetical protein